MGAGEHNARQLTCDGLSAHPAKTGTICRFERRGSTPRQSLIPSRPSIRPPNSLVCVAV